MTTMIKSLKDLALNITEQQYRDIPSLSYSTLAKYEKGGFSSIKHLYDKVEGESLTFGSVVDTLVTEGENKFKEKFAIASFDIPSDSIKQILDNLLDRIPSIHLEDIDDSEILESCFTYEYQPKWKNETKVAKIRELGTTYFNAMQDVGDKRVIPYSMYSEALSVVKALKENSIAGAYLQTDCNNTVEFLYQQKFKTSLEGQEVKCMFDLIIVNYDKKIIIPIDLKTSSRPEYDFPYKYLEFRYDIQSRLYTRVLEKIIKEDSYFKDFQINNFRFIVVNKESLTPLVWVDENCKVYGDITLTFNSGRKTILRDPIKIAKELQNYLDNQNIIPEYLSLDKINSLTLGLSKL